MVRECDRYPIGTHCHAEDSTGERLDNDPFAHKRFKLALPTLLATRNSPEDGPERCSRRLRSTEIRAFTPDPDRQLGELLLVPFAADPVQGDVERGLAAIMLTLVAQRIIGLAWAKVQRLPSGSAAS